MDIGKNHRNGTVMAGLLLFCLMFSLNLVINVIAGNWADAAMAAGGVLLVLPTAASVRLMGGDVSDHNPATVAWQHWTALALIAGAGLWKVLS